VIHIVICYHHFVANWNLLEELVDGVIAHNFVQTTFKDQCWDSYPREDLFRLKCRHCLFVFNNVVRRYLVPQEELITIPLLQMCFNVFRTKRYHLVWRNSIEYFDHCFQFVQHLFVM
jgi:hypothetical protein